MEKQSTYRANATDTKMLQATVYGRVQGVGFRAFVHDCAHRLGLSGYVANMGDGTVYIQASGRREALDSLLAHLQRGPTMARVQKVDYSWHEGDPERSTRFEVRG